MNKNIIGITVEIGGDTGPLGKALKSVEATGKSLPSELKEVNHQLKFNPNSTVLLKQKQDLLRQSTENLREKQAALKQAVEQAFQSWKIATEGMTIAQKLLNLAKVALFLPLVLAVLIILCALANPETLFSSLFMLVFLLLLPLMFFIVQNQAKKNI